MIIYTKSKLNLYALPYSYSVQEGNKLTLSEKRFKYFIFNLRDTFGYHFDSINSKNPRKMNVDSLLKERAFKTMKFFDETNNSLISSIENSDGAPLIEKYIPKLIHDHSYPDTAIYYYSNQLKNLDYSFSKNLEKEKKLKIFKAQVWRPAPVNDGK